MPGASIDRLGAWAMALPSVSECRQARSKLPAWQVSGRTFLRTGADATTAVFRISEASAALAVAGHP
jgi:hypothetical protein